ncbi:MAG: DUF952 domain-containing protein [Chloroflexi bacterium]|nr:DUF952 domain-containing protein [Chloroflexota bacterium]
MIYHMLPAVVWAQQADTETYTAETLASEGFIHCTGQPERLIWVANRFYRQQATDFLILCIEPTRVQAEIKWEQADQHLFPHIYGPLNRDAIVNVIKFPRDAAGLFILPPELA